MACSSVTGYQGFLESAILAFIQQLSLGGVGSTESEARACGLDPRFLLAQARRRLRQIPNKSAAAIENFAKECLAPGAVLRTDDGGEFEGLAACGFCHQPLPMLGNPARMDAWLPLVSTVTANLKAWLDGTFHGVGKQHLQAYLNEFMFRFNRRFYRAVSFRTLLGLGSLRLGPTYRSLYDRNWVHRDTPPSDGGCAKTG